MKKTYAVLGGGGSFGLHTSKYLLDHADPAKVIAVGRNLPKDECFTLGIGDGDPRYSYHAYHVNYELDLLMELLDREKPQVIINFAAQGEGATSLKHSWRYFETNCVALVKLAEELQSRDYLERFIQIGTSELYGSVEHAAKEDEPIKPTSPYAASKAAFDMHLMSIHRFLKFPMNIIRPSNAYGPGQQLHRVIPKTVICGLTGRKLPLHGGGRAEKSYIHNRDLARAIHMVAEKAPLGAVYNAGSKEPTSIRRVVELVAEALKIPFEQLCEVTGDRQHQDFALLARQLRHQARCRLGAADQLGGRHARNGRVGAQISAAAQEAADRIRHAGLMPASEARVSDPADAFLGSRTTLRPAHAVAALLQLSDGRYVMQLRDSNPDIFYPEHWGCFGGAVDPGEAPAAALVRELEEELAVRVVPSAVTRFTEFTFDFGFAGDGVRLRTYYAVTLPQADLDGLVLGEGADLAAFAAESLLAMPRVVPYDAFALWMYHARGRIASSRRVAGHAC